MPSATGRWCPRQPVALIVPVKPTTRLILRCRQHPRRLAESKEMMEKVLLTVDEAAEKLAVSRWTMYRLMKERYVVSVQVGRCRRVTAESLAQYVAALVDGVA